MSIGHKIIDATNGLYRVAYPDPDEGHVFVWSSGAAEQIEALVMQEMGAELRKVTAWHDSAMSVAHEMSARVVTLEAELAGTDSDYADMERYVRELETENDRLRKAE